MPIIPVSDPHDDRIAEYRNVPDGVLLRQRGLFIAEGRLVVRQLLEGSRLQPQSLLVTEPALGSLRDVVSDDALVPIYLAPSAVMTDVVGFNVHRGCLALGVRPAPLTLAEVVGGG